VYLKVNFNVFFKLINVHLLVSELYMYIGLHVKYPLLLSDFNEY